MPQLQFFLALILFVLGHATHTQVTNAEETPPVEVDKFDLAGITTGLDSTGNLILDDHSTIKPSGLLLPTRQDCQRLKILCPLINELQQYLEETLIEKAVFIKTQTATKDRYHRTLAQIKNDQGTWIQQELLERGLARVITTTAPSEEIQSLLPFEDSARKQNRGLWGLRSFQVIPGNEPEAVAFKNKIDRFQIVEGIIEKTADVRGKIYLNFGKNWRTDFTIKLSKNERRNFSNKGKDLLSLQGTKVRVRGWLFWENGPMIGLYNPVQLEILPSSQPLL